MTHTLFCGLILLIHLLFCVMKAKEISSDVSGSAIMLADDVTRPDRTSTIGSTRPWTDVPAKMPVCVFVYACFLFFWLLFFLLENLQ